MSQKWKSAWIASGIAALLVVTVAYPLSRAPAAYFAHQLDDLFEEDTEDSVGFGFDIGADRAFYFTSAVGWIYAPANWAIHRAPDPVYVWFSDYWLTWNGAGH